MTLRPFFRLAIVNTLSNLMVPLAGLIDVSFLGHLSDLRHLAGVALATVLFNYIYWTFGFLRMGTTGTTAQAMGRQDAATVLLIGMRHGVVALGLGLLILLFQGPLRSIGFALLQATPEVMAAGQDYYDAMIWGAPATLLNFVLIGWFLGRSQSEQVLLLSGVGNGANVLLNYGLIVQGGWGSAGAGWATALSQYLMLGVGLGLVGREVSGQQVRSILAQVGEPIALKAAFWLNGEIMIRTFALVTTFSLFTNLSSAMGTVTLAINSLLLQVVTLAAYFIDGLAFATESLAGTFWGQGASQSLRQLLRFGSSVGLALGLGFAGLCSLFPRFWFGLLTHHQAVLDRIPAYVPWLFPILGFGSIAYMLDGYFLGLAQGRILRQSALWSAVVGFAPVAIGAWYWQSSHLLWFALTLFMAARALTLGLQVPRSLKSF